MCSFLRSGRSTLYRQRLSGRSRHSRACRSSTHGRSMRYFRFRAMAVATQSSGAVVSATGFCGKVTGLQARLTRCFAFRPRSRARAHAWLGSAPRDLVSHTQREYVHVKLCPCSSRRAAVHSLAYSAWCDSYGFIWTFGEANFVAKSCCCPEGGPVLESPSFVVRPTVTE